MTQPPRQWESTGHHQLVNPPTTMNLGLPDYDPRTGNHYWIVMTSYQVNPDQWADPTHTPYLDAENLRYVSPPCCFHCEQAWTAQLATRRCKGHP